MAFFKRKPKRTIAIPQLTSLIDVLFLLIVFFMLSTEYSSFTSIALHTPGGDIRTVAADTQPKLAKKAKKNTPAIQAALSGRGMVNMNGIVLPLESSAYMAKTLLSHGTNKIARIYCKPQATTQELITLTDILRLNGAEGISAVELP